MGRLAVIDFAALVAASALVIGCASNASIAKEEGSPQKVYLTLLRQIRDVGIEKVLAGSMEIDDESRQSLESASLHDPLLRNSLSAECGVVDVVSCFLGEVVPVLQLRKPKDESFELACLRYGGRSKAGDWLVADVYLIKRTSAWRFVGTAKHYSDSLSLHNKESAKSCWEDER
ncbi:hypothetical protein GCM10027432_17760 [Lysobacter fragariae]